MDLKGKKILVTGADGFIGSHLVELLCKQGLDVKAFCLYNSFGTWGWLEQSPVKDQVEVFLGDIRDPYGVKEAMKGCDIVLHLAALIAIPYSYHSPETYVDTNIKGTLNILQAAKELGVSKVVHTSTSEVYGTAQFVPIHEEHPLHGQSPYSASKIGADQMAISFHRSFELPVAVLRPFNTYGPRQSARAVIPTIISQLLVGKDKIKLGALSPTRDFTFVQDTAMGFIQCAACDKTVGEITNIGSGFEISIGDLAKSIAKVMNKEIEITCDQERMRPENSEVNRLFAGVEKSKSLFDWNPEHGGLDGLEKGLLKTIEWFKNPENLKQYKTDIYNI